MTILRMNLFLKHIVQSTDPCIPPMKIMHIKYQSFIPDSFIYYAQNLSYLGLTAEFTSSMTHMYNVWRGQCHDECPSQSFSV